MEKILVADDDRVVLYTLSKGLREAGYEVTEARDGLKALALCQTESPALALLDIRMPGLDGLELARRLRRETKVPFMFFSAYNDENYVKRAVAEGALGYLVKPLKLKEILPTLRTALARAQDIDGLQGALQNNRTIATAVGMLMKSEGFDQETALEHLRQLARDRRHKLEDEALALVSGTGTAR
ncbi:MAG: response regulator [Betaproteobacteria bacterium]|nr:response regulator [Betaproteobacteria bacterium]